MCRSSRRSSFDLAAGRCSGRIPAKRFFSGLQEFHQPVIGKALGNALLPTEFGDAALAPQSLQHYTDRLLG